MGWCVAQKDQSDKLEPAGLWSPLAQPSRFTEEGLDQGFWGTVTDSGAGGGGD